MMKYMSKVVRVLLLAAMMLSVCCASAAAYTAVPVENYPHPSNVKIHLFDYWVKGNSDDENSNAVTDSAVISSGINKDHALIFIGSGSGMDKGWWNSRTAGRLVKPYLVLGADGKYYPKLDLDAGNDVHKTGLSAENFKTFSDVKSSVYGADSKATADESLEYLFKPADGTGKKYYEAERLLLRDAATNRYYFNSGTHFAEYKTTDSDTDKNFTLYSKGANESSEFFPFDTAGTFSNHYFGMMMEVEFYLTQDGRIKYGDKEEDIVFSFSGDDDVFVFVDNLLVGSVGGIHGARTININFATGAVSEGRDGQGSNNNNTQDWLNETSIKAYYDDAKTRLVDEGVVANGPAAEAYLPTLRQIGNNWTFEANKKHTLRMYYLERGNYSSILNVSFNLLNPHLPSSPYTLTHVVTGGNSTLRAVPFAYDLTFDMSNVIKTALDETAAYTIKAGNQTVETGIVKLSIGADGDVSGRKISSMKSADETNSTYFDNGKVKLTNDQSITFTLPDLTRVTSVQSLPTTEEIPSALTGMPFGVPTRSVDDDFGAVDATDNAKIKATVFSNQITDEKPLVVAYSNAVLTSTVTVSKNVTADRGVTPPDKSFTFTVKDLDGVEKVENAAYPSDDQFSLENGGEQNITVIRGARFSVSETDDPNDGFVYVSGNAENMTADEETESVTVTNFYPSPVPAALEAKKSITGRNFQTGDAFTFTAVSGDFAEGDSSASLTKTINPESGVSADVLFDAISFDFSDLGGAESKVFTYTISENDSTVPGVSKDTTTYTAKVTLSKTGEGEHTVLTKDVAYYKADGTTPLDEGMTVPTFVNVYKSTGTLTIPATKTITGREFKSGDSFTFKVEPQTAGAPTFSEVDGNGEVTISQLSGAEATINFGSLNFNQTHVDKEYTYTFEEVIPETGIAGVSYSTEKLTVKVTLTDDGKGNITAAANPQNISWENTYTASGSLAVSGVKKITGRDFKSGDEFTFTVTAAEGTPMPEKRRVTIKPESGSEATIDFGAISFSEADIGKTYEYAITESVEGITAENGVYIKDGLTYDHATKTLTITVSDNGDGTLKLVDPDTEAEITATDSVLAWTNVYQATGEAKVKATKTITGRRFIEGDSFTFKIAAENAPMPTTTEVTPTLTAGGQSVEIDFGKITFTEADVGKTYTYTLTEDVTEIPEVGGKRVKENLTYDTEGKTLTIEVTDNGNGTVATAITSEAITFTNVYASSEALELRGSKVMDGRAFKADDSFEFNVAYGSEEVPESETPKLMKDGSAVTSVQINPTSGTEAAIEFGTIAFNQDHAGKTFTYKFTEVTPQTGALPSVAYSTVEHTVTVKVKDDGRGTMTLDVTEPEGGLVWTNEYRTSATQELKGTKVITGREFKSGDSFTFNVAYGSEEVPESETPKLMKNGSAVTSVTINPTSGNSAEIDFGTIALNQDHEGKTFTYTFTEESGARPGLAYDSTSYTVTIKISDDGEGHLTADVTGGDALEWTNSFAQQSGEYRFDVSKSLNGRDIVDGEFSFTMTALGSADYAPGVTEYAYTADEKQPKPDTLKVEAGADGDVPFGPAVFAPELFDREVTGKDGGKVYVYQIEEDIPQDAVPNGENIPVLRGVAYDTTKYKLVVHAYTVEEVIDGVKTVSVKTELAGSDPAIGDGKVTFNNAYQAAQTTAEISMTKHVNGAEPAAAYDGAFTFTLTAQNGAPMPVSGEAGSTSMTVANSASAIVFGQIVYTEAGEYLYTVKENPLASHISGMQIDPTVYTMKVTVTDPGDGQLIQTTQFCADPEAENPVWTDTLTFDNDYVQPKLEDLTGIKKIVNRGETTDRGDHIEYQIVITNHSRDTLRNLVIMDEVPEYTEFVSCSADGTYDRESNRVTFRKESLGAGESATFELTVKALHGNVSVTNVAVFGTPDIPETMRGDIPACLTNEVELYISVKLAGLPNTGDHTHMGWWLLMLSASVLGLCAVKKRRDA